MDLTVGQVARLAGVTIRTLHHYDAVGLVTPQTRTDAGYRLYGSSDVARLQEVLFFRELGFTLEEVASITSDPGYDRRRALERQRDLLEKRADHTLRMVETIETTLQAEKEGRDMSNEEILGVFGDFDPAAYEAEANDRWGDSEEYRQSVRRTASYSKADWEEIRSESDEIYQAFAQLMTTDTPPTNAAAAQLVDRHREHISHWFYACTPEIHAGLGQMYMADGRFTENIDATAEGLAAYMSEAIGARYA